MDRGLLLAIERAGSMRKLARALGITHQAIRLWHTVPVDRLLDVEKATGIHREKLCPELFEGMKRVRGLT